MRTALKHAAEAAISLSGVTGFSRRRNAGRTLVLAYHNIVPHDAQVAGDRSLHLAQRDFAEQLDLLQRTHDVVPLSEIFARPSGKRPRAAITFDDAYRGAVTVGVAELAQRGLPATIFVAPAFLGGASFWWDVFASDAQGLSADLREHALRELAGSDAQVRAWAAAQNRRSSAMPAHEQAASQDELADAVATGVITLGSHTWSHPNLTALSSTELREELTRPLSWLRERFEKCLPAISYPYGLNSTAVQQAAAAAGYESAFLITGGWLPQNSAADLNRFALPRLNVPAGLSLRGFELRVSGLLLH